MSGSLAIIGSFPLGGINIAAAASIGIIGPLFIQLDLALFGAFGLGSLQADISAQFKAAIDLELGLVLTISDPTAGLQALFGLMAGLQLSLPTISLDFTAAIAANISLQASLAIKLGGISALLEAALAVKLPAIEFFANLSAALSAGPVHLLSFQYAAVDGGLAAAGTAIDAQFGAGLPSFPPGADAFGIILVTTTPSVFVSMGAVLKTA